MNMKKNTYEDVKKKYINSNIEIINIVGFLLVINYNEKEIENIINDNTKDDKQKISLLKTDIYNSINAEHPLDSHGQIVDVLRNKINLQNLKYPKNGSKNSESRRKKIRNVLLLFNLVSSDYKKIIFDFPKFYPNFEDKMEIEHINPQSSHNATANVSNNDQLWNLTLLTQFQNGKLNNKTYLEKNTELLNTNTDILPSTEIIFTRKYTPNDLTPTIWSKINGEDYISQMYNCFVSFF